MNAPTATPAIPLTDAQHHRVDEAIAAVAGRLADPGRVAEIAGRDSNRDPIYHQVMWAPLTLSNGWPGVATCYGELARSDPAWRAVAHSHLERAVALAGEIPDRGLYAGPASLLAAAQTIAGGAGHYAGMRARLADWLATSVLTRLGRERGWSSYDLINGAAGTTRLLLDSAHDPAESGERVSSALSASLAHLVAISEPITVDGHRVPGWWVPAHEQISDRDRAEYPEGDFNLGLAHGIPGPLAVLSHALRRGHEVDGQRGAIRRMAEWLLGWELFDDAGGYWPCRVSFAEQTAPRRMRHSSFTRTAWCYGAPGVAAALHAAGSALGEPEWTGHALDALRAALARQEAALALDGPTLCHGYAGLLAVYAEVGSGDPVLRAGAARLVATVLGFADEDAPFVFPHWMRYPRGSAPPGRSCTTADVPGLLEGAAGVAATLHTVTRGGEPAWDRCLGLR
ncbi:MAG TPA: lanthionine synthetase C family protein [Pseudonocardiaceae bacterium]